MLIWNSAKSVQFRIDDIARVMPIRRAHAHLNVIEQSTVRLRDGTEFIVYDSDLDSFQAGEAVTVIPALPGFSIIHTFSGEAGDDERYSRAPIIAWQVTTLGDVRPVTVTGVWDDMFRAMPIEDPNGVVRFADYTFDDVGKLIEHEIEERAAIAAKAGEGQHG